MPAAATPARRFPSERFGQGGSHIFHGAAGVFPLARPWGRRYIRQATDIRWEKQETAMSQPESKLSRRTLFAGAATVGAAAAAVAVLPSSAPGPTAPEQSVLKPPPERGGGYQLTERVKQYYKSTLV
ncbi:MAG: hypothetical protein NVS3B2_00310 [Ramlibacter sp.]